MSTDVVGIVSERDLHGIGEARLADKTVGDVMTATVISARPTMTVRKAANLLRGHSIGCLPVLEAGRLVGIVTTTDLLELIGRGVERPVAASRRWTLGRKHGALRPAMRP